MKLKSGDYVYTGGMSKEECGEVVQLFIDAGCQAQYNEFTWGFIGCVDGVIVKYDIFERVNNSRLKRQISLKKLRKLAAKKYAQRDIRKGEVVKDRDIANTQPKPKTININGFEVPEPVRDAKEIIIGERYYMPCCSSDDLVCVATWSADDSDLMRLSRGIVHKLNNKEAAELHTKALLSFTKI